MISCLLRLEHGTKFQAKTEAKDNDFFKQKCYCLVTFTKR